MPPMNPLPAVRSLAFRPHPRRSAINAVTGVKRTAAGRSFADDAKATNNSGILPKAAGKDDVGPNMQQQEHVSEEAAKVANIMGQEGPDIEGQGTPVQEILKNEPEVKKTAPQVLKDDKAVSGKRSFSTFARRMHPPDLVSSQLSDMDPSMIPTASQRALYASPPSPPVVQQPGHKFPLPQTPLSPRLTRKFREEPIVDQFTKLMMQDGKLAKAQRWMSHILTVLRTNPSPTYSPTRTLLPGAPPASYLPLNPVLYLTLAIDSLAPLMRIRNQKGAAGGGMALQIPVPLHLRQRRRIALNWILDAAEKRKSRSSGKLMFPQKVADEIISVIEGKSAIWQKRDSVHKLSTTARSNLNYSKLRKGGRR